MTPSPIPDAPIPDARIPDARVPDTREPRAPATRRLVLLVLAALAALLLQGRCVSAQWNPLAGQWLKQGPADLRVMTFNVADGLCSSNDKQEGPGNWCALARLVAALKPDVLLLQESGDNDGNGTGSSVDSAAELAATLNLFLHGGVDVFHPGGPPVTAWVQLYDPTFDLPFTFASDESDGYNRNAILSRFPFADLNGDGSALQSDLPLLQPDAWAPGGDGGIRGWGVAEIDLPDDQYAGDVVVGNSHLKAGTASASHDQRVAAAQNIAWGIQYLFNGDGGGVPDPAGKLADEPPVASVLPPDTLLVTGGDWNEDETKNGTVEGPANWIRQALQPDGSDGGGIKAAVAGAPGGDGTDRDGSDMLLDGAQDVFTGSPATLFTNKYDYVAWQDSIGTLRRSFVFSSASLPADGSATPPELLGFATGASEVSYTASDHRPVIVDLVLPPAVCNDAKVLGGGTSGSASLSFTVCGQLSAGRQAVVQLAHAPPGALAVPVVGFGTGRVPLAGGMLVPSPPLVLPGWLTSDGGTLEIEVTGGGGPLDLVAQWVVLDVATDQGPILSDALVITWLP